MQTSSTSNIKDKIKYLVGNADIVEDVFNAPSKEPFSEDIIDFLNDLSKEIMNRKESKQYSDLITFAFWIRKSSIIQMKEKYYKNEDITLGRGVSFHIAPSNVPVNFAYSLVVGLITGNKNIVRVPSKDFPQVEAIANAINETLKSHKEIGKYILLVRYDRDKDINDFFSSKTDTRVIWGGDNTISEIRKSPLPPRSNEITFADRYSLTIINSDEYLNIDDKKRVANDFYNDTYFTDQNACTSPRIVIWTGNKIDEAKETFWSELHKLVKSKYVFQDIQGVNKLTSGYLLSALEDGCKIEEQSDNLIVRVKVPRVTRQLMDLIDNSGYFFEYDCSDLTDVIEICNDKKCQTIGYLGETEEIKNLVSKGVQGIDRVVPIGKTMDFDLIWDGYDLLTNMTRIITIS